MCVIVCLLFLVVNVVKKDGINVLMLVIFFKLRIILFVNWLLNLFINC